MWVIFFYGKVDKCYPYINLIKQIQPYFIDPYLNFITQNGKHSVKNRYMRIGLDNSTNKEDTGKDLFSETYYLDYKFNGRINYLFSDITFGQKK